MRNTMGIVLRYLYGMLRLGFTAVAMHVFNETMKQNLNDIGGFTMFLLRGAVGRLKGFFGRAMATSNTEAQQVA